MTLLCPTGALSNLASTWTGRLPFAVRVRHDDRGCKACGKCEDICPTRAVTVREVEAPDVAAMTATADEAAPAAVAPRPEKRVDVSQYLCNACLDCVKACPSGALRFGRPQ